MTSARRAGAFPAQPFALDLKLRRSPAFACAGVLAALNAQADLITSALTWMSPLGLLSTLGGIAAVIWFAMYAALKIGFEDGERSLNSRDWPVLLLVVGLSLLPVSYAAQSALLLCATYLWVSSGRGDPARRISLVLLPLTGPLIWGRLLLQLFATQLLALDAHLVGSFIGTRVQGNVVRFAGTGHDFLIGTQCSSVHNISLAIVLWTTAAALFDLRIDRKYVAVGLVMVAFMFALNIARLAAIGLYPASFEFLHSGTGAELFGWSGILGVGVLVAIGVISAAQRQR